MECITAPIVGFTSMTIACIARSVIRVHSVMVVKSNTIKNVWYGIGMANKTKTMVMLLHPKMATIIACIVSMGHFSSPGPLDLERYALGLTGVLMAVFGVYRVNEVRDFESRGSITVREHRVTALVLIFTGVIIGISLAVKYAWWILVLLIVGAAGMLVYNLSRSRIVHNVAFYGVVWGSLPYYCSYVLQGLDPVPTASVLILSVFWGVVAIQTLWLWGTMGCKHQIHCRRVPIGMPCTRICHSPIMRCVDRYNIPRRVREHTKIMINIQVIIMVILTMAIGTWRYGM
mgnify:CR=1 FL=1